MFENDIKQEYPASGRLVAAGMRNGVVGCEPTTTAGGIPCELENLSKATESLSSEIIGLVSRLEFAGVLTVPQTNDSAKPSPAPLTIGASSSMAMNIRSRVEELLMMASALRDARARLDA